MVQASVGYQCPECTHARPQKVVSGAAAFAGGAEDVVVGKALIGLNVVAYVATVVTGGSTSATGPLFQHGVAYGPAIAAGEWWRIITGGFLHASPLHLISLMRHYESFAKGTLHTGDLAYFLLAIGLFLALSVRRLDRDRLAT